MDNPQIVKTNAQLGELEHEILRQVWGAGPCTAEACREALSDTRPLKDSTVRTVLRRLEEKGLVTHTVDGRTFLYTAAEERESVAARAVRSIIDRFCGGSIEQLLVGLVDNKVVEKAELERLAKKIAAAKERAK